MPPSTTRTVITDDYPVENGGESSVIMVARPVGRWGCYCWVGLGQYLGVGN